MTNGYKVGMISLGCPKNQVDGEALLAKLAQAGYQIVNEIENSDVMIVNTCGFIEDAKREAIDTILEVAQYKEAGLISAIVVTGCLAERYQDEILKEMPEVDAVIGIGANSDIVKVCDKALCGIKTSNFPNKCYLPLDGERMLSTPPHWAYLKIAEGCDNRCAYCAIPGIRGNFRSRTIESVVDEAKSLVNRGVKEIILVAQDTTKYGQDLYGEYSLDKLLKELVKIDGLEWIRLFYCYPQRITDSLIDVIANEDKVCKYIDIPLQHSDATVLKNMNRVGGGKDYRVLLNKMREAIPGLALRTTFMVGFPGETDEQFENLCEFVKDMKFDKMGCFTFSPEEDTPAFDMENQIDEDVKKRRQEVLMNVQFFITEASNKGRVGNVYKVIVDSFADGKYTGRSYMDSPEIDSGIIFTSNKELNIGDFVDVKITDFDGYDLIGEHYEFT
ncbi:30S ribosomal protein S12 methylthiotransferase RimO [Eubacterium coprostanoligenes]|uniref:30S ribosomal protein S12 methylthiotransferase RimO n=1 Tax=Eubacterium coprostanoligenes TaxID=290054 RepID=UPI002357586E|nr:30S ribosomal protein S12 methylthiotransferase RimO [Eubacterium coprostanoligenes]MCI6254427.1 30S ribosomal protein S12 methylthiotransferase RimO [Eubacterium coprostanoligenes]MDY5400636.1 30S ribosomal protein S12 methylthiotransferase RimO [Eubacterium coprostanoligenes]